MESILVRLPKELKSLLSNEKDHELLSDLIRAFLQGGSRRVKDSIDDTIMSILEEEK